jgi:hypothetical protein
MSTHQTGAVGAAASPSTNRKKTNHTQEPNAVGMPNKDCAEKWALTADVH